MNYFFEGLTVGMVVWRIFAFLSLLLSVMALVDILKSKFPKYHKIMWLTVVVFTSLLGVLMYHRYGVPQKLAKSNSDLIK